MTKRFAPLAALTFSLLAAGGCSNKLAGAVEVDGKPFQLASCRSGQYYGFAGVQLEDPAGARLRLVQLPTGEGTAVVWPAGAPNGFDIGKCGPMTLLRQSSTINRVHNVEGTATLSCSDGTHSVKGQVSFSNCH